MDQQYDDLTAVDAALSDLQRLYGDDFQPFTGAHHARFIDPDVPLHVISRVFQGRHLLRPCPELNDIILGVIGRAQQLYRRVDLFAFAFMSNHFHLMLQGPPEEVPAFIGFIKREVSRRWGAFIDWPGAMWHEYSATALPTPESQVHCLKYILSQGVKEGLVERPQDWPGVHAAKSLLTQQPLRGHWLDGTRYARAKDAVARKPQPSAIDKREYLIGYDVMLKPIPAWEHLDAPTRAVELQQMAAEIEAEGRVLRGGRTAMGAAAVTRVPLGKRTKLPPLPWFEARRRMICWSSPHESATREYLDRYWTFQQEFREASVRFRRGETAVEFPRGAYRPGMFSVQRAAWAA